MPDRIKVLDKLTGFNADKDRLFSFQDYVASAVRSFLEKDGYAVPIFFVFLKDQVDMVRINTSTEEIYQQELLDMKSLLERERPEAALFVSEIWYVNFITNQPPPPDMLPSNSKERKEAVVVELRSRTFSRALLVPFTRSDGKVLHIVRTKEELNINNVTNWSGNAFES